VINGRIYECIAADQFDQQINFNWLEPRTIAKPVNLPRRVVPGNNDLPQDLVNAKIAFSDYFGPIQKDQQLNRSVKMNLQVAVNQRLECSQYLHITLSNVNTNAWRIVNQLFVDQLFDMVECIDFLSNCRPICAHHNIDAAKIRTAFKTIRSNLRQLRFTRKYNESK
jgi:hypothetical protein